MYADDDAALVDAVCEGDPNRVEHVLLAGVNADALSVDNIPVLHIAAEDGNMEVCQKLVLLGATVDFRNPSNANRTALHVAAIAGHEHVVAYLICSGAEVDAVDDYKMAAMHYAAKAGARALCTYLIEKGASIRLKDSRGLTPIDYMNGSHYSPEAEYNIGGVVITDWQLRRMFEKHDKNNNGFLEVEEVRSLWESM
eukprot:Sspe_Gene.101176::Locus_75769_Transcript_1_1_Confidence_1.000_Length_660::g.101176::m.101176